MFVKQDKSPAYMTKKNSTRPREIWTLEITRHSRAQSSFSLAQIETEGDGKRLTISVVKWLWRIETTLTILTITLEI